MIEVRAVSKSYGRVEAVREASFTVADGQIVALLGPNGAGKTTLMKILAGYHYPDSGDAFVQGRSVVEEPRAAKSLIGYLPESAPLYSDMLVERFLSFVAEARGLDDRAKRERIASVASDCGISSVLGKRIGTLSKGFRQRVALAQAIVHDPPILILDEPTSGLDPNQIVEIRSLIRALGRRKTVLLSTHVLQEAESLCSRVLIVSEGRVAAEGTTSELTATAEADAAYDIVVRGADAETVKTLVTGIRGFVSASAFASADPSVCADGICATIVLSEIAGISGGERLFEWAAASQLVLVSSTMRRASLEDAFVRITRQREADA